MENMSAFHILAIRFSSMGDVILQTGLIEQLKKTYGSKVFITFVTSKEFASLVEGNPFFDKVLILDRKKLKLTQMISELKKEHQKRPFNLILDLHSTLRTFALRTVFPF